MAERINVFARLIMYETIKKSKGKNPAVRKAKKVARTIHIFRH